jgi:hypothetical protein
MLAGGLALAGRVYAWLTSGVLDSSLCGGRVGLLLIGAITWFYWLEDRRAPQLPSREEEEIPTPEEYDQAFHEIEEPPRSDEASR